MEQKAYRKGLAIAIAEFLQDYDNLDFDLSAQEVAESVVSAAYTVHGERAEEFIEAVREELS